MPFCGKRWYVTFNLLLSNSPNLANRIWNNCETTYFLVMFKVFVSVFIFVVRPLLLPVGQCHSTAVAVYLLKTERLLLLVKLIMSVTDKTFHSHSYFRVFLLRIVLFLQIIHRRGKKKKKKKAEERAFPGLGIKTFRNIWQRPWSFICILAHLNSCSSFPLTTTKPNMERLIPFGCGCFGTN